MEGSIPSSSISTPTPAASSSSPSAPTAPSPFKPRRSEEWNKYKDIIEQLYRVDQLKLKNVREHMRREYNFEATEKQYKDRLSSWGCRKNVKASEVGIMIRKQERRAAKGKKTIFRVAGQPVDTKRIARFQRRHGANSRSNDFRPESRPADPPQGLESPEPSTPSDMSYYTPEPDERPTTLSISPHPDNEPRAVPLESRLSVGAKPLYGQNRHRTNTMDFSDDSETEETKCRQLNAADYGIAAVPPIADDPRLALEIFNGNNTIFGNHLEKQGDKLYFVNGDVSEHH